MPTSAAAQARPLLATLAAGRDDARVLIVSDSTAAAPGLWPDLLASWFATDWPSHRVSVVPWNYTTERYDPPRGGPVEPDGRPTLTIYSLSVGGKTTDYAQRYIDVGVVAVAPDLIVVSLGLNEATADPTLDPDQYRAHYLGLTETLAAVAPRAGMVLVLQNPETNSTGMAVRNAEYARVARLRGCGLIDVHSAFLGHADWRDTLMRDARHPNDAGQTLWAREVQRALVGPDDHRPSGRRPSSLRTAGRQLIHNGRLADWAGGAPAHWLAGNAELTRTESGCRLRAVAPAEPSYLEARITGPALAGVLGRRITVAARILVSPAVPAVVPAQAAGSAGLLELDDHRGRQRSRVGTVQPDRFVWVCATHRIDPGSPYVSLRLYAGTGGDPAGEIIVDRVTAAPGLLPRDLTSP